MTSVQVMTTPLLRQFATKMDTGFIEVATKLGPSTISRSTFAQADYPSDESLRRAFLMELVHHSNPLAAAILKGAMAACIADQAVAIEKVLLADK